MQILSYFPGQTVTIYLTTLNSDGYYVDGYYEDGYTIDGYSSPVVHKMIKPSLATDGYYPQPMIRLDVGIYRYTFTLSSGSSALGTYFVDVQYRDTIGTLKAYPYIVQVNAPFGLYSVTPF